MDNYICLFGEVSVMACEDYTTYQDCVNAGCFWHNYSCHQSSLSCQGNGWDVLCGLINGVDFLNLWLEDEGGNVINQAMPGDRINIVCRIKNDEWGCENFFLGTWLSIKNVENTLVCYQDRIGGWGETWDVHIIWDIPANVPSGQQTIMVEEIIGGTDRTTALYIDAPECWEHTNQSDCEAAGCYWYNNSCHEDPPDCENYNTKVECEANYCEWYNQACHSTPPTTCEILNNQSDCTSYGCYWYNNSCHTNPPCESYTTEYACVSAGCYWCFGACQSTPCGDVCSDYGNQSECESNNCFWYNGSCHDMLPSCGELNNQTDCLRYGCYWYDGVCHSTPPPTCEDYTTQATCNAAGCYWWTDNTCHSTPQNGNGCETYTEQSTCEAAGCYWYQKYFWENPKCHSNTQNMIMDYLPFILIGTGGVIILSALIAGPARTPRHYPSPEHRPQPRSKPKYT